MISPFLIKRLNYLLKQLPQEGEVPPENSTPNISQHAPVPVPKKQKPKVSKPPKFQKVEQGPKKLTESPLIPTGGHPQKEPPPSKSSKFPEVHELSYSGELEGGTKPKLYKTPDGRKFVVKAGGSPEHVREELMADSIYKVIGAHVPESKEIDIEGPKKISSWVDGLSLGEILHDPKVKKQLKEKLLKNVRQFFVADALLANWDVGGISLDNLLVDSNGQIWRIDTGGSGRYRGGGKLKPKGFGTKVGEIQTLTDPDINPDSFHLFEDITPDEIKSQVRGIVSKRSEILKLVPKKIRGVMEDRIDFLEKFISDKPEPPLEDFTGTDVLGRDWQNGTLIPKQFQSTQNTINRLTPPTTPKPFKGVVWDEDQNLWLDSETQQPADGIYKGSTGLYFVIVGGVISKTQGVMPTQQGEAPKEVGPKPPAVDVISSHMKKANPEWHLYNLQFADPTKPVYGRIGLSPEEVQDAIDWIRADYAAKSVLPNPHNPNTGKEMPEEPILILDAPDGWYKNSQGKFVNVEDHLIVGVADNPNSWEIGQPSPGMTVYPATQEVVKEPITEKHLQEIPETPYGEKLNPVPKDAPFPNARYPYSGTRPRINYYLPDQARPELDLDEVDAVEEYTEYMYDAVNDSLYNPNRTKVDPEIQKIQDRLYAAFSKGGVFDKPIQVYRGVDFLNKTHELQDYVDKFKQAKKEGIGIELKGFQSCSTNKNIAESFAAYGRMSANPGVFLIIEAISGLDLSVNSVNPGEDEVLLNTGRLYDVVSVSKRGNFYKIHLRQETP